MVYDRKGRRIAYLISAYVSPLSLKSLVEALQGDSLQFRHRLYCNADAYKMRRNRILTHSSLAKLRKNTILTSRSRRLNGYGNSVDFYIHIDKKADIVSFKQAVNYNNVIFLDNAERVLVKWGGYSQVCMQYNLLKKALDSGRRYCRYVNLTGTDYPIAPNRKLRGVFEDASREFIIGFPLSNETGANFLQRNRVILFWLMDAPKLIRGILKILKIKRVNGYEDIGHEIYFGSEYWALTGKAAEYVVKQFEASEKFQRFLKYSFVPSEMWVHTIFFNSDFAKKGVVYHGEYAGLISLSPLSYFEYGDRIKILKEEDYEKISSSGKLFCRKVLAGESDALRTKIEQDRR